MSDNNHPLDSTSETGPGYIKNPIRQLWSGLRGRIRDAISSDKSFIINRVYWSPDCDGLTKRSKLQHWFNKFIWAISNRLSSFLVRYPVQVTLIVTWMVSKIQTMALGSPQLYMLGSNNLFYFRKWHHKARSWSS